MNYSHRLVYAITIHPILGYLIEPFMVRLNGDKSFSLDIQKVSSESFNPVICASDDTDHQIIMLCGEYTDFKIAKKFSKRSKKTSDFFKTEFSDELFTKHIRPFIERRINSILSILISNNKSIHYKGNKTDFIRDNPIKPSKNKAGALFHFIRNNEGIRYFITVESDEQPISLFGQTPSFLCHQPVWLLLNDRLFRFDDSFDSKKLLPFFSKEFILAPKSVETKFFKDFVVKIVRNFNVVAEGFNLEIITQKPTPVLSIELNWQEDFVLIPEFSYPGKTWNLSSNENNFVKLSIDDENVNIVKVCRDREFETNICILLLAHGLDPVETSFKVNGKQGFYSLIEWLDQNKQLLQENGIAINQDARSHKYFIGFAHLDLNISAVNDWFDIMAVARFGDFKIPLIKLKKNILNGKREFKLPDGTWAVIPEEWFAEYSEMLVFAQGSDENIRIHKQHISIMNPGLIEALPFTQSKIDVLTKPSLDGNFKLPNGLQAELRPYQKTGLLWMEHLTSGSFGACLCDDMGLGKTVQAIGLLLKNLEKSNKTSLQIDLFNYSAVAEDSKPSLVIMPTSLIHNWERELRKFAPSIRYYVHSGPARTKDKRFFRNYDVVLTSYGIARNDLDFLSGMTFEFIILDESQQIKNPDSKIFQAVIKLKSHKKVTLTGTPVENSVSDLWAQMTFLNSGLLGSRSFFKEQFIVPIEKQYDSKQQELLKKLIDPFIFRRTKNEVAKDLPPLIENIRFSEMTSEQKTMYETTKSEIRNILWSEKEQLKGKKMIAVLRGLMKLRQIACHPVLSDPAYIHESGKFEEIAEHAESIISEGHKVLIFSSFVRHLELFEKHFREKEIPVAKLTGKVRESERKVIIDEFQNNNQTKIFLISLKAGGVGLNLTAADYVFILDPWWNPASEMQAINRAHRIGQDKNVISYKFISKDTVEEKILDLQERKRILATELISTENPLKDLSDDEIIKLFE